MTSRLQWTHLSRQVTGFNPQAEDSLAVARFNPYVWSIYLVPMVFSAHNSFRRSCEYLRAAMLMDESRIRCR
jgi:hypothetical protein